MPHHQFRPKTTCFPLKIQEVKAFEQGINTNGIVTCIDGLLQLHPALQVNQPQFPV